MNKKMFNVRLLKSVWADIRYGNAPDTVYVVIAIMYMIVGWTAVWLLSFIDDICIVGHIFFSLIAGLALLALTFAIHLIILAIRLFLKDIAEWLRDINVRNGNGEEK